MTYKQLQDEVIALRFDESRRASVKSWLNLRYAALWDKAIGISSTSQRKPHCHGRQSDAD